MVGSWTARSDPLIDTCTGRTGRQERAESWWEDKESQKDEQEDRQTAARVGGRTDGKTNGGTDRQVGGLSLQWCGKGVFLACLQCGIFWTHRLKALEFREHFGAFFADIFVPTSSCRRATLKKMNHAQRSAQCVYPNANDHLR